MTPRRARIEYSLSNYFHVCARGNNKQEIFFDDQDYRRYLRFLNRSILKFQLSCYAYCLMPNHTHLLFKTPTIRILSKTMQSAHGSYVMCFNRKYKRVGHLFQDRFISWIIQSEKHLLEAKEYIENNPVRARLVNAKEKYPWSSAGGDGSHLSVNPINA